MSYGRGERAPLEDRGHSTLSKSRVERARRSRRVTTSTSPGSSRPMTFASSGRSLRATRGLLLEHLGAAGGRQLIELQGQVLIPRADPSVSVKRHFQLHLLKLRYETINLRVSSVDKNFHNL